jgi:hypothetical protein
VATLRCPCEQKHKIWGELWWTGDKHEWAFVDDLETSETYTENITYCPGCGRRLERKNLKSAVDPWRALRAK